MFIYDNKTFPRCFMEKRKQWYPRITGSLITWYAWGYPGGQWKRWVLGPWSTLPCSVEWAHQCHGRATGCVELCPHVCCLAGFPGRNQPPANHPCASLCVIPLEYITQLCCRMEYFTDFLRHLLFPSLCSQDNLNYRAPLSVYYFLWRQWE